MSVNTTAQDVIPVGDVDHLLRSAVVLSKSAASSGLKVADIRARATNGIVRLVVEYAPADPS